MGYRYRLHVADLPGKPDLVFGRSKKIIFVHGCFWHMHKCQYGTVKPKTNADFWENKRTRNVERDKRNIAQLRKAGWKVLILWECWTKNSIVMKNRICKFLEQ
jgi:DNA mismatch endonuclease (patch repair protein)